MAPPAATTDVFHAIAEPRRREILDLLRDGERPVGDVVDRMGLTQPQVSKHLRVLKEVGLVSVRRSGRRRLYSVRGRELKKMADWVRRYERFWAHQLEGIKERAESRTRAPQTSDRSKRSGEQKKGGKS